MDLNRFQWKKRLLLLFAPDASDPGYIAQWDVLNRHQAALKDRDVLILSFFEEDGGDLDGEPIDEADADAVRQRFRVKRNMAMAILIGKDGTEKRRDPLPAPMDQVIALIDSMPMRQQEMKRDRS